MKFIHLSDLHLGKRVNEYSMLEDQEYILKKILCIIDGEKPDGVLIAGDVYDKSVPGAEAVQLFDDFLYRLSRRGLQVFVISGNHDSPERLAFGGRLMDQSGVHLSPVYDGTVPCVDLEDAYGKVHVYLLPFLKPSHVRRFYPEEKIETYTEAVRTALGGSPSELSERNVLVTHQFVAGAERSESEELTVGGSDHVDGSVFQAFDYVALGHLHGPQNTGTGHIRYCGTPLKYSFSEAGHQKSVTIVELGEKGNLSVRTAPLQPRRDLREIRGTYMELTDRRLYEGSPVEDYLHITLTDEEDIPDAVGRLKVIYPNLMRLDYDNHRTRAHAWSADAEAMEKKTPLELFMEFYEKQNNQPMKKEQKEFSMELIRKIWEGEA